MTRPPSLTEIMSGRWVGALALFVAAASATIAEVLL